MKGKVIQERDLGSSIKAINTGQNIMVNNNNTEAKEESVEELMQKLAKKGKKVKLLDETAQASVKELPKEEQDGIDEDPDLDRDDGNNDSMDEINEEVSPTRKKIAKVKKLRE